MSAEVEKLIELLQLSLTETLVALVILQDPDLDDRSDHPCAMGGTVRDLLTHNIDHERMHTGQIYSARYSLQQMQKAEVARLLAETYRARADLIAALIGLPDEALDARSPDDDWTIRQIVEHTVYWERHSVDDVVRTKLGHRQPVSERGATFEVSDPIYGPLAEAATDGRASTDPTIMPGLRPDDGLEPGE